jgi:hypothetical protein
MNVFVDFYYRGCNVFDLCFLYLFCTLKTLFNSWLRHKFPRTRIILQKARSTVPAGIIEQDDFGPTRTDGL